jgi:transposase
LKQYVVHGIYVDKELEIAYKVMHECKMVAPMYIRMKTSKKAKYPTLQIVEGVRDGKKVRQRTVAHLGVIKNQKDLQRLKHLAEKLIERLEKEGLEVDLKVEMSKLKHKETIYDGFGIVVDRLMSLTGFSKIIQKAQGKNQFDVEEIVKLIIAQRFDLPSSKLRTFERQQEHGFHDIELQHIYRAMDAIESLDSEIQKQAFDTVCQTAEMPVDCFFFDVTTLYFESVAQNGIKDFGFSKDQKHHMVQIVLALVVDSQGIPLAYDTFKGNLAETKTLIPVLEKLRDRFSVKNVTVICDRGLASNTNVEALQEANFHYVIATKLRSISKKSHINDISAYSLLPNQENIPPDEKVYFRTMEHPQYKDTLLIATYNLARARKDKEDRERLLEKLRKKLGDSSDEASIKKLISNNGYKKYTNVESGSLLTINEEAVEEDSKWDGFHGIAVSNSAQLTVRQALARYRDLWRVEEAFRVAKCTLKTRPIFHWVPHRINSHVLLCFMNLFFERFLELLLRKKEMELTPDRIRHALEKVHTTIFEDESTKREGKMQSALSLDAEKIFQVLEISLERRTVLKTACCA